jgi:hypothetical protein
VLSDGSEWLFGVTRIHEDVPEYQVGKVAKGPPIRVVDGYDCEVVEEACRETFGLFALWVGLMNSLSAEF